jgi:hypothetical protein
MNDKEKIETEEPDNGIQAETLTDEKESDAKDSRWQRFLNWYKDNKKKSIPMTVLVFVILLVAIPWPRYHAAGLVLKNDLSVQVTDSSANTPVSGADIAAGNISGITNASGKVTLRNLKVGNHTLQVRKKYYKDIKVSVLVPIFKQKITPKIAFTATGRQTKVTVTDLINHSQLNGVDIKVSGTSAITDKSGSATVVLPIGTSNEKATLSLKGYNTKTFDIKASNSKIEENNAALTPAGKVYFLSKLSGKIDVVKTDLDGANRKTVLAGTGKEDDRATVLLASRDWKFLALQSRREGVATKLYLLDTSDDSLTTIDGAADVIVNPVGWSEHDFIYTISRQSVSSWQANQQALKSYDAESNKITLLDQTKGEGTGQYDYANESYGNVYQIGKTVVYDKYWTAYYSTQSRLNDKQAAIYSISAGGGNPQTLKTFGYADGQNTFITSVPYEANSIYYQAVEKGATSYLSYGSGKLTTRSDIADDFAKYSQQGANTYLQSPSGNNTFWSESRDGKSTLFVGDENGENDKQIATLSDFKTYGWYTDDYLLVSKNNSELYIMPKAPTKDTPPLKITDYHKPAQTFNGYGGGYGGI